MNKYAGVPLKELFELVNGRAKFTKTHVAAHNGEYPVYSASLTGPFGFVDEFGFDGRYLTWVMNGYGGRVQEVCGRFSANRDRGVFVPREGVRIPDLTYLRFAMEPQLMAAAVGRRVDGKLNEYTKIYPDTAKEVVIQLPLDGGGDFDYCRMAELGQRFRRIEAARADLRATYDSLRLAAFAVDVSEPAATVSIGDEMLFALCIGKRVLRIEHTQTGVPVYSANALVPFGTVKASNLSDFTKPSLLWGIDGIFDWNLIPKGETFATTDHCGRLRVLDSRIDPEYVYWFLKSTRWIYGFDRVYRASLQNMKAEVTVTLPIDSRTRKFSLEKQRVLAETLRKRAQDRAESVAALDDVLKAQITIDL